MPLWCQNDPIVQIKHDNKTAVIKIITKVKFTDEQPTPADDPIFVELTVPFSVHVGMLVEHTNPLIPQQFAVEFDNDLGTPAGTVNCRLYVELPEERDPEQSDDVEEVTVVVRSRHKELLTTHTFTKDGNDGGCITLEFPVVMEDHDHSKEVIADTSTWS